MIEIYISWRDESRYPCTAARSREQITIQRLCVDDAGASEAISAGKPCLFGDAQTMTAREEELTTREMLEKLEAPAAENS
jgi:hypothetical protein